MSFSILKVTFIGKNGKFLSQCTHNGENGTHLNVPCVFLSGRYCSRKKDRYLWMKIRVIYIKMAMFIVMALIMALTHQY